jgi:hypothetical protein
MVQIGCCSSAGGSSAAFTQPVNVWRTALLLRIDLTKRVPDFETNKKTQKQSREIVFTEQDVSADAEVANAPFFAGEFLELIRV